MLERIQQIKSVLDNSGTLSKADKAFIKKSYQSVFGSELVTATGCTNCWKDGVILLLNKLMGKTAKLRYGAVVTVDGVCYNHKTITLEITNKILAEQPELKHLFYGL